VERSVTSGKTLNVSQVVCRGFMSYLYYLYLCMYMYSGVPHDMAMSNMAGVL
jgi:hypothetical protein